MVFTSFSYTQETITIQWEQKYCGGLESYFSNLQSAQDGGYVIVGTGYNESMRAEEYVYIVRTDSIGDTIWTSKYSNSQTIYGVSVCSCFNNEFIFAANTYITTSDCWLLKLNENGDTSWTKIIGSEEDDRVRKVIQTSDSGYIVCGTTENSINNTEQGWIFKTDKNGNVLWEWISKSSSEGELNDVIELEDKGLVALGCQGNDLYLIKFTSDGDSLWLKSYEGFSYTYGGSMLLNNNGNFIISGSSFNTSTLSECIMLLDVNQAGEVQWFKKYYPGGDEVSLGPIHELSMGGYIFLGCSYLRKDVSFFIQVNSQGDSLWLESFSEDKFLGTSLQLNDNEYMVVGDESSTTSDSVYALLQKVKVELNSPIIHKTQVISSTNISIVINSSKNKIHLECTKPLMSSNLPVLSLFSLNGKKLKEIESERYNGKRYIFTLNNNFRPSNGVYIYQVTFGNEHLRDKIFIE